MKPVSKLAFAVMLVSSSLSNAAQSDSTVAETTDVAEPAKEAMDSDASAPMTTVQVADHIKKQWYEKWQVWGGAGIGFLGQNAEGLQSKVTDIAISDLTAVSFGYHWGADLMVLPYFGLQYSWMNMGQRSADIKGLNSGNLENVTDTLTKVQPIGARGHKLALIGQLPLDRFTIYMNAGALFWDSTYSQKLDDGSTVTVEDSGIAPVAGIRLDEGFTERLFGFSELQGVYVDSSVRLLLTMGMGYRLSAERIEMKIPEPVVETKFRDNARAVNDLATINEGATQIISVAQNDKNINEQASFEIITAPMHGSATVVGKTIEYQHDGSATDRDVLYYQWTTNQGVIDSAVVDITIAMVDDDSDGVRNALDKCAATPAGLHTDLFGCPVLARAEKAVRLEIAFASSSDTIPASGLPEVEKLATLIKQYQITKLVLEGHSSTDGVDDYNLAISENRAQAVKDKLVDAFGISADLIQVLGRGETMPIIANEQNAEDRQINRRVEAVVIESKQPLP